ncbi:MAG: cupin domain-containing protein [Thermoleophilia bacterium]|nr:cupin domain-containing protein [Thermoleophilia bacterium]
MYSEPLRALRARSLASPAANFQGAVRNHHVTEGKTELEVLSVWFPAGGRTNSHAHTADQVLVVTEGEIAVGIGTDRYLLRPGEMIVIPPNVWHWHGATPHSDGCHLSIKLTTPTDWGAPPAGDQVEFDAYDDWASWLQGAGG